MNQNYQMVPPVYYQNPLEEKKLFFFRKNCNSVAKALWLNLLLQFALTFVFEFVYIMVRIIPEVMEYLSVVDYTSFEEMYNLVMWKMSQDPMFIGGLLYVPTLFIMVLSNLLPVWYCSRKTGLRISGLFCKGKTTVSLALVSIVVMFGMNFLGGLFYNLFNALLRIVGLNAPNTNMSLPTDSAIGMTAYILLLCLLGPVTEELLFRGVLLRSLTRYGTVFAAVSTSVMFGLMHGNFGQFGVALLVGLLFSYLTIKTGSIRLTIGLHILNNSFSVLTEIGFQFGSAALHQAIAVFSSLFFIGCLIATIVILIVLRKKIHFVSDNPISAQGDNIISIPKAGARFWRCGWVLAFLIFMILFMLLGIFPGI